MKSRKKIRRRKRNDKKRLNYQKRVLKSPDCQALCKFAYGNLAEFAAMCEMSEEDVKSGLIELQNAGYILSEEELSYLQ